MHLTKEEQSYIDNEVNQPILFKPTPAKKIDSLQINTAYKLALIQNDRYKVPGIVNKVKFQYNNSDTDEIKALIKARNNATSESERIRIGATINVIKQRELTKSTGGYSKYEINTDVVIKCNRPGCNSTETSVETRQLRAADEPAETFYLCLQCNKRFKVDIKFN